MLCTAEQGKKKKNNKRIMYNTLIVVSPKALPAFGSWPEQDFFFSQF